MGGITKTSKYIKPLYESKSQLDLRFKNVYLHLNKIILREIKLFSVKVIVSLFLKTFVYFFTFCTIHLLCYYW